MSLVTLNLRSINRSDTASSGDVVTATSATAADFQAAAAGITAAHQWRVTSTFTNDAEPITSNWEQVDSYGYGGVGSVMSQSSGVFTFPETGIWLIHANWNGQTESGQSDNYGIIKIETTTNNSSYNTAASGWQGAWDATVYRHASCQFMFDVTDTSNCKCRFAVNVNNTGSYTLGNTNESYNSFTFIRLADT